MIVNNNSNSRTQYVTIALASMAAAITSGAFVIYYTNSNKNVVGSEQQRRNDDDDDTTATTTTKNHQRSILEWKKKRDEERKGRIRAEQKLRSALKSLKQENMSLSIDSNGNNNNSNSNKTNNKGGTTSIDEYILPLSTIGLVHAPYPKRMGTPRQGQLVPSSRGYIQLVPSIPPAILDGIQDYSHLWVIFQFHENTSLATSRKTKIRPPRGGGIKVGQLSTRSPHRPNPLGLSLVTINRWEPSTRRLYINGLDLVDGTPVYDVKPYVHWDIPNEVTVTRDASNTNTNTISVGGMTIIDGLKLPKWVETKDDVLPKVVFEYEAEEALKHMIQKDDAFCPLLYPKSDPTSFDAAKQTLIEILSQDPRSSHRGVTKNQRGTDSRGTSSSSAANDDKQPIGKETNDDTYKITFGNAIISFLVLAGQGAVVKDVTIS